MVKEFDELRKHIKSEQGKKLAKEFRKRLVRAEKYSVKLDTYLSDTLDGMEPERSKNELGL